MKQDNRRLYAPDSAVRPRFFSVITVQRGGPFAPLYPEVTSDVCAPRGPVFSPPDVGRKMERVPLRRPTACRFVLRRD